MLVQARRVLDGARRRAGGRGAAPSGLRARFLDRAPQGHQRRVRRVPERDGPAGPERRATLRRGRRGRAHPSPRRQATGWPTRASSAIRWWRSPGSAPETTAPGRDGACRPRPSGKRPPAATTGRPFPWGRRRRRRSSPSSAGPTARPSRREGRPAGASPHGVEDMLGNLREWTSSRSAPIPTATDDGREPYSRAPGAWWSAARATTTRSRRSRDPAALLRSPRRAAGPSLRRLPLRHVGGSRRVRGR